MWIKFLLFASYALASPFDQGMLKVAEDNGLVGMGVLALCNGAIIDEFYTGHADIDRNISFNSDT